MTFQHSSPIIALDFSEPYGTLVTSSSSPFSASDGDSAEAPRVYDMLTATEVGRLRGHKGVVKVLQVEEHLCVTGGTDGCVRVWDLRRVDDDDLDDEGFGNREHVGEGMVRVSLTDVPEEVEDEYEGEEDGASVGGEGEVIEHPRIPSSSNSNGIRSIRSASESASNAESGNGGACARVLEGHSKSVTALYFEDNCLVTGASDKTLRQWDLTTGQCIMTMDILWALSHPPPSSYSPYSSSQSISLNSSNLAYGMYPQGSTTSIGGTFAVPTPPFADGNWDMYEDFVGGVQFWGYALVSGSGDGAVRMWDSEFFFI